MQLVDVLVGAVKRAVSTAVSTLVSSFFLLGFLTLACAFGAYRISGGGLDGVALALIALAAGGVGTVFGAVKRAIGHGARAALEHAAVGRRVATVLVDRLAPTSDLAGAERAVEGAVWEARRESAGGWLAGRIRAVALALAEAVVLVLLRKTVRTSDGAVDVDKLRTVVTEGADDMILARVNAMIRATTMIALAIIAAGLIPAIAFHFSR
ncbi:MAG: hypothetical protein KF773_24975 [Deltaproteobacteria bacterium]|nr:hypothetical protein [Deltaproteobacteria bacterium]MCW5806784.1 hypothetical protein [Deltaproteobacteria bacterium]